MRTKTSNANLYLYTFLGLLFAFAATVNVDGMASDGVANQQARADAAMRGLD